MPSRLVYRGREELDRQNATSFHLRHSVQAVRHDSVYRKHCTKLMSFNVKFKQSVKEKSCFLTHPQDVVNMMVGLLTVSVYWVSSEVLTEYLL